MSRSLFPVRTAWVPDGNRQCSHVTSVKQTLKMQTCSNDTMITQDTIIQSKTSWQYPPVGLPNANWITIEWISLKYCQQTKQTNQIYMGYVHIHTCTSNNPLCLFLLPPPPPPPPLFPILSHSLPSLLHSSRPVPVVRSVSTLVAG